MLSETSGQISEIEVFQPLLSHQYRSAEEMTSTFETSTRTLRYELRSREIYIEERTPIMSPETLLEPPPPPPPPPPQTQDESVNTIQETPNSQFMLLLSVTPCMPRINTEKSVNCSPPPPHLLAPLSVTPSRTSHLLLLLAPPRT